MIGIKPFILALSTFAGVLLPTIADVPRQNTVRLNEIARLLNEKPGDAAANISNREIWNRLAALPSAARHLRSAEALLDKPVPVITGEMYLKWYTTDYVKDAKAVPYYVPFWARRNAVALLTTAECLENKGRFLPKLQEYLLEIAAMRTWVQPSHDPKHLCFDGKKPVIDIASAEMAHTLALSCDWLRGRLRSDVYEKAAKALEKQIFTPYRLFISGSSVPWWFFGDSNWNAVCHCGSVCAALSVVPERMERAKFLEAGERGIRRYLLGFYSDGVCREGMDYWNYGFGNFLRFGLTVRRMTQGHVDFFAGGQAERNFAFAFGGMLEPWIAPHFADGGANPNPLVVALGAQAWPKYRTAKSDAVDIFAGGIVNQSVRMFEPDAPARAMAEKRQDDLRLPIRTWYPVAQILTCRPDDRRTGGLAATIKGGNNGEHHNHNDLGSYAILLDGVEMAGDPGGAVYTKTTFTSRRYENPMINSFGHPVPAVAGHLQRDGAKFATKTVKTDFSENRDSIVLDLTGAYDVPELQRLLREMTYRRAERSVSIRDTVQFSKPSAFETPLVTFSKIERGADDSQWLLSAGKPLRKLWLKIDVRSGGKWTVRREKIPNPKKAEPERLSVAFQNPISSADVQLTFSPAAE